MDATKLGIDFAELITPGLTILIALVFTMWFKDLATKMAKGVMFKMNRAFNEGDSVIIDGQDAVIVRIGMTETVFGIYGEKGYTWRYVPNERIPMLKLEKIVNKDVHLDTPMEKALQIQKQLDELQNQRISENQAKIDEMSKSKKK
jgi:small-conductance mechanosensitive channel|tara:strand:- start:99 stop:536 length:438 start_codon:yes stop_codon:yes gene_type:complete